MDAEPRQARLLVTTSTFPRYAGDRVIPDFVLQLCTQLSARFAVDVLAPHAYRANRQETLGRIRVLRYRYAPVACEVLAGPGGILPGLRRAPWRLALVPLFAIGQALALWRLLRHNRYIAVHAHWLIPQGLIAALVLKCLSDPPPLIVTAHGSDVFALRGIVTGWLRRWVLKHTAVATVVSEALRGHLLAAGLWTRVEVLPMGVDVSRTFTPPDNPVRRPGLILFVGRLTMEKGVATLLEALARIRSTYAHAHLWLIGAGPDESALRRQARVLGLGESVRFPGAMSAEELGELYRRAQIVAFPSHVQEGLGLVPIEALACACAVVASDLPAVREVIVDGVTGLLAQPADAAHLAAQLRRLLDSSQLCRELGERGRQHVLRFDWTRAADGYARLFDSLMPGCADEA